MSTSSSAAARQKVPEAAPFPYAEVRGGEAAAGAESGGTFEEESLRQRAEAFEQGRQQGQQQLRAELDAALAKQRQQIAAAVEQFAVERENYYRRVEAEVVQLALAIARKILHREAQLDPHALAGIVRITLEKLDAGTGVNLHVHPRDAAEWRHYFACQMESSPVPEIHEDPGLLVGECRIQTSLGATQVGFETQLKEIETGLLDLLAERPGSGESAGNGDAGVSPAPVEAGPPEQRG